MNRFIPNPAWFKPDSQDEAEARGGPVKKVSNPLIRLLSPSDNWHHEYCEPIACLGSYDHCPVVNDPWAGVRGRE